MTALSIRTVQRIADDTGHQAGTLEKVLRLLDPAVNGGRYHLE
jgi:hypothetical protein